MAEKQTQKTEKNRRRITLAEKLLSGIFVIGIFGLLCYGILLLLMTVI